MPKAFFFTPTTPHSDNVKEKAEYHLSFPNARTQGFCDSLRPKIPIWLTWVRNALWRYTTELTGWGGDLARCPDWGEDKHQSFLYAHHAPQKHQAESKEWDLLPVIPTRDSLALLLCVQILARPRRHTGKSLSDAQGRCTCILPSQPGTRSTRRAGHCIAKTLFSGDRACLRLCGAWIGVWELMCLRTAVVLRWCITRNSGMHSFVS